jgi:hypothetical protein
MTTLNIAKLNSKKKLPQKAAFELFLNRSITEHHLQSEHLTALR